MIKENQLPPELIRRFIRIEQRVSAHFGKPTEYNQTEYFKSLTNREKRSLEMYLKKQKLKKKRRFFLPIVVGILFLCILFLSISLTGQTIQDSLHVNDSFLTGIFVVVLIIIVAGISISFLDKKRSERRFNYHLKPLEMALAKSLKK